MSTTFHDLATDLAERTVATRRDLHRHPEIAFEETRTMGVIAARLRELGLDPRTGVGGTGVVALWDSGRAGPTVLARADIDALPVRDDKDVPYRSTQEGKHHACGHDGHTAVLLSACEALLRRADDLSGRIVFLFQPAEEIGKGAKAMLADGALDGLTVDHVIGLHLTPLHPTGTIAVREGPMFAASDRFDIVVRGRGGHAAIPQNNVDPIVAAAQIVSSLQALVSRETDPVDQAVVSVTRIQGGTAYNIIPDSVELSGTYRSFLPETRERLARRIVEVAESVAAAHGASAEARPIPGAPAVVNDPGATEHLRTVAESVVGPDRVIEPDRLMGGDDMAFWLQQAPGVYFFVGSNGGPATAFTHHHPSFDVDEAALPIAVEVLSTAIASLLGVDET